MKEAEDIATKPCSHCKVDVDYVNKLDSISDDVNCLPELEDLCGWGASDSDELLQMIYTSTYPVSDRKSLTKIPPDDQSATRKKNYSKQDHEYRMRKKKKPISKLDPCRLDELSAPRRVRQKVKVPTVSRVVLPFNETSTFASASPDRQSIAKIAFQYRKRRNEPLTYLNGSSVFACYQTDHNKFAIQRKSIENSLHEFILSKSRSQSTSSLDKFSKFFESPVLARTRENTFVSEHSDRFSDGPCPHNEPENPIPTQSNLFSSFVDQKIGFDAILPPIKAKKSQIGSITAISDRNRKVGIKSHSIKKLGRHLIPQPPMILPRLSGSKVEVPVLPRSPDFFHRLL